MLLTKNIYRLGAGSIGAMLLCALLGITAGCENFVETDLPSGQLTGEVVFADTATAEAALLQVYIDLRTTSLVNGSYNGLSNLLGNYTDELDYYSVNPLPEKEFNQNNLVASNQAVLQLWNSSYKAIYGLNAVVEGVTASTDINEAKKRQLIGEAVFTRSFIHFYLSQLFGNIPYVASTDYRVNARIAKTQVEELYTILLTDLETAVSLLPEDSAAPTRLRPTKSAAAALSARIRLYAGDWDGAQAAASQVLESGSYSMEDIDNVFLSLSSGTIWQLDSQAAGQNTLEAQAFIFTSGPPPLRALRKEFVSGFEQGDLRRQLWIGEASDGQQTWYYPFKYRQNNNTPATMELSIMFRIEEMILIRAEARSMLNDLDNAADDLNRIRERSGLEPLQGLSQSGILKAILQERKAEFFTELGHRFFDLKRTGEINSVLTGLKPGWDATDSNWPLPEAELLVNPNLLPQNQGY